MGKWRRSRVFAASASAGLVLLAGQALAQTNAAYKAPRNAHGQPDLTGDWSNASLTPQARNPLYGTRSVHTAEEVAALERGAADKVEQGNASTDPNLSSAGASGNVGAYDRGWVDPGSRVMRVRGEPRTSILTTPDGQPPVRRGGAPRTLPANAGTVEAGRQAVQATLSVDIFAGQGNSASQAASLRSGAFDNPESRGVGERCILSFGRNAGPPMLANGWYNNNYHIAQSPDSVAIVVEMVHDVRVVRLNQPHRTDGVRPYFGDSVGRYEGDTLVVETINIPRSQAYNGSWENLKVTERFTRVGPDRLRYQFTVEDPTMWDKPWGGEYEFTPSNGQVLEYACHEGNYALEGVLAGAREAERQTATASR